MNAIMNNFANFDTVTEQVENIGIMDRVLRGVLALTMIGYLYFHVDVVTLGSAMLVMAGVLIGMTAAIGWDPLYSVFGWRTHEADLVARFHALRNGRGEPTAEPVSSATVAEGPRETVVDYRKAA